MTTSPQAGRAVLQRFHDGTVTVEPVPVPAAGESRLLVRVERSLVSAGTERMLVDFGRANLLQKARQQPDRVRDVVAKARTDGLAQTVEAVRSKLLTPTSLGYAAAGEVISAPAAVADRFPVGSRVATAGPHADVVAVAPTLAAPVPDGVPAEHACFATVGSVGLQGLRLAAPELGETFVVVGLGLIGLLTAQLLAAQGCRVIGIDLDPSRRELAAGCGAETVEPGAAALDLAAARTAGRGVDGVLICASTSSSEPVHEAALMCRQRGRIVLVGVTGLELDRRDFYEKELTFQVSSSYGPGRYDPAYEGGHDYPFGHVRWTAARNMEAFLALLGSGRLDVAPLITHEFDIDDAPAAYDTLLNDRTALGIVLRYPAAESLDAPRAREVVHRDVPPALGSARIALIGAGNFAAQVLAPAIVEAGGNLDIVVSRGGTDAAIVAERVGARRSSSDVAAVFDDPAVDTVVVATRHDSHARYAAAALRAGKHAFVEKPLVLDRDQLHEIVTAREQAATTGTVPVLALGFNRRFAPSIQKLRELVAPIASPKSVVLTMNAGALPPGHWTLDPEVGGGRILGEAIHLIDLARFVVESSIVDVMTGFAGTPTGDTATVTLAFDDGSIATVHYFATGSKRFPKERVEVFAGGRVVVDDNYRAVHLHGERSSKTFRFRGQDKGHVANMAAFVGAVRGERPPPIPFHEIVEVHAAALTAAGR